MNLGVYLRRLAGVGAANMADRVVALALGVLLAHWLGVEDYGRYAFVMAAVSLLLIPAKLGLPDLIMREFAAFRADSERAAVAQHWLRQARWAVFAISVLISGAVALLVFFLADDVRLAWGFYFGLALLPALALLDLHAYALRGLDRAVLAQFAAGLFPSILALAFVAALAAWAAPYPTAALGARLVAGGAALGLTAWLLHLRLEDMAPAFPVTGKRIGHLLKTGLPFLLIGGVAVIMTRTDVVMLGFLTTTQEVGLYNAALQGAMLVTLVLNTANTIVAPEFSRLHAIGDRAALEAFAVNSARVAALLALPVALVMVFFGGDLLGLLFGEEFAAGSGVVSILSAGYLVSLVFGEPGFLLNMTGHQEVTFKIFLFSAIFNVGLNAAMIPLFGSSGAAFATVISLNLQKAIMYAAVRRVHGISISFLNLRSAQ